MAGPEWRDYIVPFWRRSVKLIDGTEAARGEHVMRRHVDGSWQYREPTEEEDELYEAVRRW